MKKYTIRNREGLSVVVEVEQKQNQKGLVFIVHGLGGFKEQHQMEAMKRAFLSNGYTVIRHDSTNSTGESDGKLENATMTQYYQDLEDVIDWSKTQNWYQEPFTLIGHSLGGFCVAWYTINHPNKVKAVAPISLVISGKLFSETKEASRVLKDWKKKGIREWESTSRPGVIKKLKYNFIEDAFRYDLLKRINNIKVPTLLMVGENDETTPPKHQKLFYKSLDTEKEFHVIEGVRHTFTEEPGLTQLENIISNWIKRYE